MNITEKYRPKTLEDVAGQDHIVKVLKKLLEDKKHSSFIFEGPSGVGKTTLARICADMLNCTDLREIDAASNSGIDEMKVLAKAQDYYAPLGGSRVFIVDECQRLSKNAWDSLLKNIESPPPHNYWIFCTTEISKVPRTIITRCSQFKLKEVSPKELVDLMQVVRTEEKLNVSDEIIQRIAGSVSGSPREALVRLQQADGVSSEELEAMLSGEAGVPGAFDLARLLSNKSFEIGAAFDLLTQLKDESPESIRHVVRAYFTTFALRSPTNKYALGVLSEFEAPAIEQNRITDIVMRVARINKWRNL